MKICISVTNDIHTDQRVNRTARSLSGAGYEVLVIGRHRSSEIKGTVFPFRVKRFHLLFKRGPLFYAEYNLRLFIYLLTHPADIYLSCDLDTLTANYMAARLTGRPIVYDSHEYFTEVPELVGRPFIRKTWEGIEKRILPHIRFAYTVSYSIAQAYQKKYGIQMEVIPNYPFRLSPSLQPDFSLKKEKESIILYQGAVNVGRGLELAVLAMKFLKNTRLVIAGDGDILRDLQALAENAELTSNVTFCGRISLQDLPLYTMQADLGISLEEDLGLNYRFALPNKLFDYIQAGIPVLVSGLPEMKAVVDKYDIGKTITTTDPRELAACIKAMLDHSDDRKRWKENLIIAAEQLCWEKVDANLLQIFEMACKSE